MDSAHFAGCSLGGLISIFFVKKYANKVKSLTISGAIPEKPEKWEQMHETDVAQQTQLLQNKEAIDLFNSMHDGDWKQFLYMVREPNWYPFDETNNLDTLEMPILFMVGEEKTYEVKGVTIYPKTNRHIHVSVIPFAGHLVHLEQPEIYTKVLEGFLNRVVEGKVDSK
ncbi:alpha/beta hydrolase [Virgibacillus necropolis]